MLFFENTRKFSWILYRGWRG